MQQVHRAVLLPISSWTGNRPTHGPVYRLTAEEYEARLTAEGVTYGGVTSKQFPLRVCKGIYIPREKVLTTLFDLSVNLSSKNAEALNRGLAMLAAHE